MSTDEPTPSPRKRGGQPGNHNAVIHGLYARRLPSDVTSPNPAILPPPDELDEEIAMIRLSIRNLVAQSVEPQPLDVELLILRSLSLATAALNRLVKTRIFLDENRPISLDRPTSSLDDPDLDE